MRFIEPLQSISLALGGAAGARLGNLLGYASSGSTLLNHLHRLPLPTFKTPKALGVDDFAFRKGHNYGTILVDLETHQPIALLSDRKAETLIEWLQAHPGIEVLSRDRSKTYKSAMDKAAPDAMQVADRFHVHYRATLAGCAKLKDSHLPRLKGRINYPKSLTCSYLPLLHVKRPTLSYSDPSTGRRKTPNC